MSLGTPEIMFVVVLVLLLFGPDRLPGLLKSVGRGMREIKRVTSDFQSHFDFDDDTPPRSAGRPATADGSDSNETIPPYPTTIQQPQLPLDQAHHETIPLSTPLHDEKTPNEKEREA